MRLCNIVRTVRTYVCVSLPLPRIYGYLAASNLPRTLSLLVPLSVFHGDIVKE